MANLVENADQLRRRGHPGPGRAPAAAQPAPAGRPASRSSSRTTAPGSPLDERDHLFERFYRGSRAGQRAAGEGTGLGLSLVAEHVRLHGGRVWSEDAPGGGTRFVVELPLHPVGRRRDRGPLDGGLPADRGGPTRSVRRPSPCPSRSGSPPVGSPRPPPTPIAKSDVPFHLLNPSPPRPRPPATPPGGRRGRADLPGGAQPAPGGRGPRRCRFPAS